MARLQLGSLLFIGWSAVLTAGCSCHSESVERDGGGGAGGGSEGGTGGEGGSPLDAQCYVAALEPLFGAQEVDVAGSVFRITWSESIDPASIESGVRMIQLGDGTDIPLTTTIVDDRTVDVSPASSLRFWQDYGIEVAGSIMSSTGEVCLEQSTAFSTRYLEPEVLVESPAPVNGFVTIGSFGFAVSNTFRGLQVYDLTDPIAPSLVGSIETEPRPVGLSAEGDRLYVAAGYNGVLIFDASDPGAPVFAGVAGTPGYAAEVAPFTQDARRMLAVADGAEGLRLIDVTNPKGAVQITSLHPSGEIVTNVTGVDVEGDLVSVAQGYQGFALVDVSTPEAPVVLASRLSEAVPEAFDLSNPVSDVALDGSTLFLALGTRGFQAFDVSTPSAPVFVDHELSPQGFCPSFCNDPVTGIRADQGELFASSLATGAVRLHLEAGTLVTDATLPVTGNSYEIFPTDGHLYVAAGRGLAVFERDAADGSPPSFAESGGTGILRATVVAGERLYAISASRGVMTYSLADPLAPTLVNVTPTPGLQRDIQAVNLTISDSRLLVGDGRAGFSVYSLTDPDAPELVGTVPDADIAGAIELNGDVAYVCNDNRGLWVVDYLATPPVLLNELDLDDDLTACRDLELDGDYLYVAEGNALGVFDVSSPGQPFAIGELALPASDAVNAINLHGDFLYASTAVADYEGTNGFARRFLVFDISDRIEPVRVFKSDDLGEAGRLVRAGDKVFVSAGMFGAYVFDVSNPLEPFEEGLIDLPGLTASGTVGVSRDVLYFAQQGAGLSVVQTGRLPVD